MPYLDTDVIVDVLRNYPPAITWLKSLEGEPVVLSGLVVMELYQGCRDKVEHEKVKRVLAGCKILWPSEEICAQALSVFVEHHLSSGIGILDSLIGQTGISLAMPLCTFNQRHYQIIPGIVVVEPYSRTANP